MVGQGSAPDHTGAAYEAPPGSLVSWGGAPLPIPLPLSASGISNIQCLFIQRLTLIPLSHCEKLSCLH